MTCKAKSREGVGAGEWMANMFVETELMGVFQPKSKQNETKRMGKNIG